MTNTIASTPQSTPAAPESTRDITHAVALDARGIPVLIEQARRGAKYICVNCARRMVPCRGRRVRWYYRHVNVSECVPDSVNLHEAALNIITKSFQDALSAQEPYLLTLPCSSCPTTLNRDLAESFNTVEIRDAVNIGDRRVIDLSHTVRRTRHLEVVVLVGADELPPGRTKGPVAVITATWEALPVLSRGLQASHYRYETTLTCRLCKLARGSPVDAQPEPVDTDRFDQPLYQTIHTLVNDAVARLMEVGFRQSAGKPYLLYRRFEDRPYGVAWADLGGRRGPGGRIWTTQAARLTSRFEPEHEEMGHALMLRIVTECDLRKIPVSYPGS